MIGVRRVTATATHELGLIHPVCLLGMPTDIAALAGISGVNRLHSFPGAFCLESEYLEELTPSNVMNTAGQIPASQTTDVQIFVGDQVIFVDQSAGLFVAKIQPLTAHLAMNLSDHSHGFLSTAAALVLFATHGTLCHTQFLHGVLKVSGVVHKLPIGGGEKMCRSHVNADALPGPGKQLRFDFADVADVPLPAVVDDRRRLDLAFQRSAQPETDVADLAEVRRAAILSHAEARLRVGEGIVAVTSLEAGKARLLTSFDAPEERLIRLFQSLQNVLQHLGVDACVFWCDQHPIMILSGAPF